MPEELINQVLNNGSDLGTDFALIATAVAIGAQRYADNISEGYGNEEQDYSE